METIEGLKNRIRELEEALRPFAEVADIEDEVGRRYDDDDRIWITQAFGCQLVEMSIEDFRSIRELLDRGNEAPPTHHEIRDLSSFVSERNAGKE